ncbi:unnamed protein product [Closterium sp. NIES-64]|nr:unnamed protein product [Closterium sp. NIES-64]
MLLPSTSMAPSRSALRLPLAGDAAPARARGARALEELVGAVEVAVEAAEGVGVAVGGVVGVGASVAAVEAEALAAVAVGAEEVEEAAVAAVAEVVAAAVELVGVALRSGAASEVVSASSSSALVRPRPPPHQLREWYAARQRGGGVGPCAYVLRTSVRTDEPCGGPHTIQRYFGRLTDAWRLQFLDATEIPRWGELLRSGAAALGAGEAAALGASASAARGAGESPLSGTTSAQALHTFTLDSGASRSFFRDRTTLTPLRRPVAVSLADPSGGPILAHFSTVLPCPAAPSGTLSGLYLPSFSTNLVAASGQVFAAASRSGPESAPCSCRLQSNRTLLWHHRLGHPSLPRLRGMASRYLVSGLPRSLPPLPPGPAPTCVPRVEGRQRAAPHSSEFPPTEAPLQTLHLDMWGPTRVRGQSHECYFLLVVDGYSRYTMVFPLRSKGEVTKVLIDWIRAARLQLRESFGSDFLVMRLHSDRGGEFSSDHLRAFCRAQGIRQTFTLPASPHQNGIAERRIGMVMDVARTSMIHAAAPHFLWPFAVQYAAHHINNQPLVSLPETSPTLRWTGKVGDAAQSLLQLITTPFHLGHALSQRSSSPLEQ